MYINSIGSNNYSTAFSGHSKSLDKKGSVQHNFFYLYDTGKYKECKVQLYNIDYDIYGKQNIELLDEPNEPAKEIPLTNGRNSITIPDELYSNNNLGFAYRFKLIDNNDNETYAFDNGDVIGIRDKGNRENKFNVVLKDRALINKNGPMQLIMPDGYYPIIKTKDGKNVFDTDKLNSVRTHANKLGGKFEGIIERLPEIAEKEGISRIVGTPFTKDTVSSHLYWTENAYQVAPSLGTEKDFKRLQQELFRNGINWVADAALVNEGLNGIHLTDYFRKGQDSYAKDMFRTSNDIPALGILPDYTDDPNDHTIQNTKMKLINPKFFVSEKKLIKNIEYDLTKPTYIQLYDRRLVSYEQMQSDSPLEMKTYAKTNPTNNFEITKHDDAVYPFAFEVDPNELTRNLDLNKEILGSSEEIDYEYIDKVANFPNFSITTKSKAAQLELWDGNVDIAKLKFYLNPTDYKEGLTDEQLDNMKRGSLIVQDYSINSGRYWTQTVANYQRDYIVSELSKNRKNNYLDTINDLVSNKKFPKLAKDVVDDEIINNVLNNDYHSRMLETADERSELNPEKSSNLNDYTFDDYILKKIYDVPLETLPLSNSLLGIVTSPYIVHRPINKEELGLSKYDLFRIREKEPDKKYNDATQLTDKMIKEKLAPTIKEILEGVNGLSDNGNISDYGRYVLSEIVPDLTKYILLKAIDPNADIIVSKDGEFDFSNVNEEDLTIRSIGLYFNSNMTEEEEAKAIVKNISEGISDIDTDELNSLKAKVATKYKNRTLNDYKIAEMIHDRTESGLGWRIDAAKDVSSMDAVRSDSMQMEKEWDEVTDFWTLFNQAVLKENPHSYTTAEITDLNDFFNRDEDKKYMFPADAEKKFIEKTGITSVANYNYFFSTVPEYFLKYKIESGDKSASAAEEKVGRGDDGIRKTIMNGWEYKLPSGKGDDNPGFLYQSPEDGVINSYTFVGNHDKPRMLHGLALDMNLYNSNLINDEHRKIVRDVLCPTTNTDTLVYSKINPKAIAMGDRINKAIDSIGIQDENLKRQLKIAVSHLAKGKYRGQNFDAEAFGTRPFDITIKSVLEESNSFHYINKKYILLNDEEKENIEIKLLENILKPALDKYLSIYKMLVTLPGSPTDFAGDRLCASGYETKAKNYHQQNRNIIHWNWLENPEKYKTFTNFYEEMNKISKLRSDKNLSALNNGTTVSLPVIQGDKKDNDKYNMSEKVQATLRYDDKGSIVISLYNNSGANANYDKQMERKNISFYDEKISVVLDSDKASVKEGLKHGISSDTVFKNINNDGCEYRFVEDNDFYGKKCYVLKCFKDGKPTAIEMKPDEKNTMILYKEKQS